MKLRWLAILFVATTAAAQSVQPPDTLPAPAATKLGANLAAARAHASSVWRDTPPINADGTINGYVEIARGDRRKWEFNMAANARQIDRMIPESIGGYPINYGFVPQTVSYDGDPFDVLVLGPPIEGGSLVRGLPVGVMRMEDDRILDSKVVITPLDAHGKPRFRITDSVRREVSRFFNRYKRHVPGASTSVAGWGSKDEGIAFVQMTHAFFRQCRDRAGAECVATRTK